MPPPVDRRLFLCINVAKLNEEGTMQAEEFIEKIKLIGGKPNFLTKASYKMLSEMVSDDEELVCTGSGIMAGRKQKLACAIVVTNKNFYAASSILLNREQNIIPLNRITGMRTAEFLTGILKISEGTTTYTYESVSNPQQLADAIKKNQSGANILQKDELEKGNKPDRDEGSDEFNKIRKYKVLLDDGIISQEEFDKKKSELLKL
jgi:hypothetical protein